MDKDRCTKNPDSADRNHNYYTMVISYRPVTINGVD